MVLKQIAVSYRRKKKNQKEDKTAKKLIKALIKEVAGTDVEIFYDDKVLAPGESITRFMSKISEGYRLVFMLSEEYFKSPSCMKELLLTYEKQAKDLQPAVVMLDNFSLDYKQEQKLVELWKKESSGNDNEKEKNTWNEYAEMMPRILAWLFGKYESGLQYRDRLFLKQKNKKNVKKTAKKIIKWLDKEIEPVRYNHLAVRERRGIIKAKLKLGLERNDFKPLIKLLRKNVDFSGDLQDSLALMKNGAILSKALKSIREFLQYVKKCEEFNPSPTFKNMVEEFTGWLLVAAVDDKKLHQIIHELNHRGDAARNEFGLGYIIFYQMLVCAFFNKPAIYTVENKAVIGEGEIKLIERGMNRESFKRFINDDLEYITEFESLINKVRKVSRPNTANSPYSGDDEAKRKRINELMAELGKFYFAVEKDKLNLFGEEFFNKIGEKFPPLVQMFMEKRKKDPLFELFISGFEDEKDKIDDEIKYIYSLLKDIPNWRG